jgi:hypothetical protein
LKIDTQKAKIFGGMLDKKPIRDINGDGALLRYCHMQAA